jgi:NAD(P)-dependent dehydrogenase (short-subunit alcohol dehydrogenase family)
MQSFLKDKNYIVTGASRGIGLAAARSLGRRGARVALIGRDTAALDKAAAEIGGGALPMAVDLADRDALFAAVDRAAEAFGGLDGIINNAGMALAGRIEQLRPEDVHQQLSINFLAQVYGCQAAIPHLRRRGRGRIVNVSSVTVRALDEFAYISIYSSTKAAIERFTLELRQEVKNDNISVTLFSPGSTASSFGSGWEPEIAAQAFSEWLSRAPTYDGSMSPEVVGEAMINILELPDGIVFNFAELSPNMITPRQKTLVDYADRADNP